MLGQKSKYHGSYNMQIPKAGFREKEGKVGPGTNQIHVSDTAV